MNFFVQIGGYFRWIASAMGVFFRIRPVTTFFLIVAAILSPIVSILASFMPLKALLLAASPTVPDYFPFVSADDREIWIMLFGASAVFAYFLTLALDAIVRKLSEIGSLDVLQGANDLAIIHNQRAQAQTFYERISKAVANFVLAASLLAVVAVVDPLVFYVVTGLAAFSLLFTSLLWTFARQEAVNGTSSALLNEKLSGYLGSLSSLIFFSGFAVLLYPYLEGTGGNVLISILVFLVLRQFLRHLSDAVRDSAKLWGRRIEINPLIFPDHKLLVAGKERDKQLRIMFSRQRRETLVTEALRQKGIDVSDVNVLWFDPVTPPVSLFDVQLKSNEKLGRYQMQVFSGANSHELVSEDFLFDLIPREKLFAPPLFTRFQHGPYEIQICAAGEPVSLWRYNKLLPEIRKKIWSLRPAESLVNAFSRSHPLLHDRVDEEMLGRMELAVDTDEEREIFGRAAKLWPSVTEILHRLPLVIVNSQIGPRNVVEPPGGDGYYIMSWGRWALEPLGTTLTNNVSEEEMQDLVDILRKERDDVGDWLEVHHLVLAQQVWALEKSLVRGSYRAALATVARILENPSLHSQVEPKVRDTVASG